MNNLFVTLIWYIQYLAKDYYQCAKFGIMINICLIRHANGAAGGWSIYVYLNYVRCNNIERSQWSIWHFLSSGSIAANDGQSLGAKVERSKF